MSAPASSRAAHRATTSLTFRLREGSIGGPRIIAAGVLTLARVPLARPGTEEQQQPGAVARGPDPATLVRLEVGHEAGAALGRVAAVVDLDLAIGHHQVGALVRLMLLELLAGRQVDGDHAHLSVGAQHLRVMRLEVGRTGGP